MTDAIDVFFLGIYILGMLVALISVSVVVGAMLMVLTHQAMRWVDWRKP